MQSISFASGGDPDTIDYVAYVAKDPINNRGNNSCLQDLHLDLNLWSFKDLCKMCILDDIVLTCGNHMSCRKLDRKNHRFVK